MDTVLEVADNHNFRFQTSELNRLLEEATYQHPLSRKGRESQDLLRHPGDHPAAHPCPLHQRPRS